MKKLNLYFGLAIVLIISTLVVIFLIKNASIGTKPENTLEKVFSPIDEIEKEYVDENGFVPYEKVSDLLDAVYVSVENNDSVSYSEKHDSSIYMILNDGLGVHYMAPIQGIASYGNELAIYSYQPFYESFKNEIDSSIEFVDDLANAINSKGKGVDYPDKGLEALQKSDLTKDTVKKLYNSDVTIEKIKEMKGDGIIAWVGHGGYSDKYHSTLVTYIEYNTDVREKYPDDFDNHRLDVAKISGNYYVCVTSLFFDHHLKDGALTNSIIYLATCHSGQDNVLVNSLLKKGALAVYCNSNELYQGYNNRMCMTILKELAKGRTTGEALNNARKTHGETSNMFWGLANQNVRVYCYGDEQLTLTKLYNIINENFSNNTPDSDKSTGDENNDFFDDRTELEIGDHIYFGSSSTENEPDIWQVINVDGDYALIYNMCMYNGVYDASIHAQTNTISLMRYHTYGSVSWEHSNLRSWLNSRDAEVAYQDVVFDYSDTGIATVPWDSNDSPTYTFAIGYLSEERFTKEEYYLIQPVTHKNLIPWPESGMDSVMDVKFGDFSGDVSQFYKEPYGVSNTTDRMFPLSGLEYKEYVLDNNLWGNYYPNGNAFAAFWLRDSVDTDFAGFYGYYGTHALTVSNGKASSNQADLSSAIRPACYIDTKYIQSVSGTGEFESPYKLNIDPNVKERTIESFVVSVTNSDEKEDTNVDDNMIVVPDVIGMEQLAAVTLLDEMGLQFQVWWSSYDDIETEPIYIVSQSIAAGTRVSKDTLVRLQISSTKPNINSSENGGEGAFGGGGGGGGR